MLYTLAFKFKENVEFERRNFYLHSVFSNIFYMKNKENTKKRNYAFFIERKKIYLKNKIYKIDLHTGDSFLDNLLQQNAKNWKEIINIQEKDINISTFLEIKDLNFKIKEASLKNWNINFNQKLKYQQYHSSYGKEYLKELIEFQANLNTNLPLKTNNKTKHGKEYFSFIKNIFIKNTDKEYIYDVSIEIEDNKPAKLLAREMVYKGVGSTQSFGHGLTDFRLDLI